MNENPNQERPWPEDLDPLAITLRAAFSRAAMNELSKHAGRIDRDRREDLFTEVGAHIHQDGTALALIAEVLAIYDRGTRIYRRREDLIRRLAEAIDAAGHDEVAAFEVLTTPLVNLVNSRTVVDAEIVDSEEPAGEPIDLEATAARAWITEHRAEALQMIRDSEPF